jgi:5-methylcytosine-specific restriction endonuclease McrA
MDAETRQLVRSRANQRCEYCGIHQRIYPDFAFHIEHIVARQHGGGDELDNLALSCHLCNSKKGPKSLRPRLRYRRSHAVVSSAQGRLV